MGKNTGISWAHHTFNPWWGCMKVSAGCANCYAETFAEKNGHLGIWGPAGTTTRRTFGDAHWKEPVLLDRAALAQNIRERIFCGSMCDWAEDHPVANDVRPRLWELIRSTQNLDWLLLTKRPERIQALLPADWGRGYPNVWLGTSVEDRRVAWRLGMLREIPAVVRFVSYEPALGPLDGIRDTGVEMADWWIYGGESGAGYRRDSDDWPLWLRDACARTSRAFWYKQTAAPRSGARPTLGGETYQQLPTPRKVPLPASYQADQGALF